MAVEDTKNMVMRFLEDCASKWDLVAGISFICRSKLNTLASYVFIPYLKFQIFYYFP